MIQVWKTGEFSDNELGNKIVKENSKVMKSVDAVASSIERKVNKESIFLNDIKATFNQHCRLKLPPYFLDSLAHLNKITKEGNDFGLRYVIIEVKMGKVSLVGGTSSRIYRLKMNDLEEYEESWDSAFDFCVSLSCDEVDAILEYVNQMCTVNYIEIGSREEFPDKMFMLIFSTIINNSADEDNDNRDKEGLVLFRLEDHKEGHAIMQGMPAIEEVTNSDVVYKSSIYPHVKNRFKSDKEYIELAQKRGVMVIKSENKEAKSTSIMFTGSPVESNIGSLPDECVTFAAVNGAALLEVLEYKQPVNGGIRKYDTYMLYAWFHKNEKDELVSSDKVMLDNRFLTAFISQKSVRLDLPEKQEFTVVKKGKAESVDETEALDNSLKNADMKKKQDRERFIAEAMENTNTENVDISIEHPKTKVNLEITAIKKHAPSIDIGDFSQEAIVDNMPSGLEEEIAEMKKSVKEIQDKLAEQKPVEVDYETEKEFRERTDNLQKSMNDIMEGVDTLNKRIDRFDNMMEIMKSMLFDRIKENMANKKNEPVNKEELDKALNETINKPPITTEVCLKDTGEELTGIPAKEAVETYLKECIGDIVNKKVLFNVMTEYKPDSVYRKLLEMVKGNVIYRCKSDQNIFYIPKDFLLRMKNFKNKVMNKDIQFNEQSLLPEKNEEEGQNEN